jgi:hypothetical protein
MSREERRNYQRQMKGMDRGPALPPGAKERAERNAARRAQRRARAGTASRPGALDLRFWVRTLLIAVVIGFIGFSLQWSEGMPRAAYVGLAVGGIALLLVVGFRFLQRRRLPAQP